MTYFVQLGLQLNMQFIQLVDQINNSFEKKIILSVFIETSTVFDRFDTVDHTIWIKKLEN